MENYDVVIIGGGIAGTGLAYNLSKQCPDKKVLIVDKNDVGSNSSYHRNVLGEITDEYSLVCEKKYKGLKVGADDQIIFEVNREFGFVNYKKSCESLLARSGADFEFGGAKSTQQNMLITNKGKYNFKYLVDCSGQSNFLKRKLNQQTPFIHWVGEVRVLNNQIKELDDNYYYYLFEDRGYFEDLNPIGKKILHGHWQYVKDVDFGLIKPPEKTLLSRYCKEPKIVSQHNVVIPCAPVLPLVYKQYAFLGDSCGAAVPSSAAGIESTLRSSELLAAAIQNDDLGLYDKNWKEQYLKSYVYHLTSRLERYFSSDALRQIKGRYPTAAEVLSIFSKYPDRFVDLLRNEGKLDIKELGSRFPKRRILFLMYNYLSLRIKYSLMDKIN